MFGDTYKFEKLVNRDWWYM